MPWTPLFRASLGLLLALLLGVGSPASADDIDPAGAASPTTPEPAQTAPAATRPAGRQPTLRGELALSLDDAIRMGLENNLDVEVVRYTPYIAYEDLEQSWGAYDPELFSEFTYRNVQLENSFTLAGQTLSKDKEYSGRGGFRGIVPLLGSSYSASFESGRYTTNSAVEALSPKYESRMDLRLTQPLMRDLIWNQPWFQVRTNRIVYEASLDQFRRDVMDVVGGDPSAPTRRGIENLYWALVARQDQVRVAEKSLETATALLDQTRTQHDVGVVSRVEVVEAEAGVAQREFELIRAENRYRNAQDDLISAVLGTGLTADSTLQIQPTDRPDDYIAYAIDPAAAVAIAFENRPEIALANQEIEQRDIALRFAKNQRLPRLDGQVAYGNQGLGGRENDDLSCRFGASRPECLLDPDNPINQPGFTPIPSRPWSNSYDRFLSSNAAEQFVAGAIFSIPIPNTQARHRVSQAKLELRRASSQKRRLEQQIILQVRTAIRNLSDSQKGIDAARRSTVAAQEQLRAERIRLEYGESTPFDVLLRESDLVQAQSEEINAFQAYRDSATGLDRAQGTILRSNNISIDAVRALR